MEFGKFIQQFAEKVGVAVPEIVDEAGRVLPTGEWGELVVTTIGMEAMPFIRYRTGDCTRILPGPCPCGSKTLRLDRLRRKPTSPDLPALDELLFSQPAAADAAERRSVLSASWKKIQATRSYLS